MNESLATQEVKEYRSNYENVNFSALRVFNTCPNLYREQFITKTYIEPEKDYFLYGSLVDCLLTTPERLDEVYVRVDSRLDASDALKYEQCIKELELEMNTPDKKGVTMIEKAQEGNKTAVAGLAKREREIEEYRQKLSVIRNMGQKTQVTPSMWNDAHETAEAIRNNPLFKTLDFNEFTTQQVFFDAKHKRKGMLDYIQFTHPSIQKLYASFKAGIIDRDALRSSILDFPEADRKGWIIDIKTTYLISKFEPQTYAGQLAIYQNLVEELTGIKCECFIIAGDKDPSIKRAQDYKFGQALLDSAYRSFVQVEKAYLWCKKQDLFPAAKELWGPKQECFRCSKCSERPLSATDAPLLVTGSIFK